MTPGARKQPEDGLAVSVLPPAHHQIESPPELSRSSSASHCAHIASAHLQTNQRARRKGTDNDADAYQTENIVARPSNEHYCDTFHQLERPSTAGAEDFSQRRVPASFSSHGIVTSWSHFSALQAQSQLSLDRGRMSSRRDMPRNTTSLTQGNMERFNGASGAEKEEPKSERGSVAHHDFAGNDANEDLFLEVANDSWGGWARDRAQRASSRASYHGKRRSLPADSTLLSPERARPKSSGHLGGRQPPHVGSFPIELRHNLKQYLGTSSVASFRDRDDEMSLSGVSTSERKPRYLGATQRSTISVAGGRERVKSPELPQYGRRRPSFGMMDSTPHNQQRHRLSNPLARLQDSHSDSPADSSEPKRSVPESESAESNTAPSTVWDELDDLKSRIKKLELTGKLPPTSAAAVSGETTERPRTATTAPTTIDSSPKQERKAEDPPQPAPPENVVGGAGAANIHPLLHSALAKAQPLLDSSLYRTLEATAADALGLAVMTGSAGPQGTAFSAASIINGVTVSDRHVRRKADTMCRNLTDLCIALCEGKHEAPRTVSSPAIVASPVTIDTATISTPPVRRSRMSLGPDDRALGSGNRAVSRLESRRTSILGLQRSADNSPRESTEQTSEQKSDSPSHSNAPPLPRYSRTGTNLLRTRQSRFTGEESAGDEDPTIRPPSRAMTDFSQLRSQPSDQRDFTQNRSPSLRDSLTARRANASAHQGNAKLRAVSSGTSDISKRYLRDSTPPTVTEEGYEPQQTLSKRRITSLNQFSGRSPSMGAAGRPLVSHKGGMSLSNE